MGPGAPRERTTADPRPPSGRRTFSPREVEDGAPGSEGIEGGHCGLLETAGKEVTSTQGWDRAFATATSSGHSLSTPPSPTRCPPIGKVSSIPEEGRHVTLVSRVKELRWSALGISLHGVGYTEANIYQD